MTSGEEIYDHCFQSFGMFRNLSSTADCQLTQEAWDLIILNTFILVQWEGDQLAAYYISIRMGLRT